MTDDQKKMLQDLQAFITFALDKDLEFMQVLATIGHDTNGLLKAYLKRGAENVSNPRTADYDRRMNVVVCEQCNEEKRRDVCIKEGGKDVCIECAEHLDEKKIIRFRDGSYACSGSDGTYECGDYVAIFSPMGDEIAYWDHREWQTDPVLVMGAIISAMAGTRIERPESES